MSRTKDLLASSRGYGLVLVLGLAASGAVAVGASRPWFRATATVEGLPRLVAEVTGNDVVPAAGALGLAALAAFGAVVATKGWVRMLVGVLITAAMVFVIASALFVGSTTSSVEDGLAGVGWSGGDYTVQSVWWRWLVAAAAALGAVCGGIVVRFARIWATMGDKYGAPSEGARVEAVTEGDVWRSIDRGDDPTIDR